MIAANETADAIQMLAAKATAINRCDGTLAETRAYYAGIDEQGWVVRGPRPNEGDLIVGVTGRTARRRIVDVCRVERLYGRGSDWGVEWTEASDVAIRPAIGWNDVIDAMKRPCRRDWERLLDEEAADFLNALERLVREPVDTGELEGEEQLAACRRVRSAVNRAAALDSSNGVCSACEVDYRAIFGARGDRALEVHHKVPLSTWPKGQVLTKQADLIVLCATCHRLVHADPLLDVEALTADWRIGAAG